MSDDAPPPRSRRDLLINLALAVGAVALYLVVMEVVLRVGADEAPPPEGPYASLFRRSADPDLRFELTPGANGLVNAAGYLGPLHATAKPPGTLRILGLGDSITMYETAEGRNYLQLVERGLRADGATVEVLNFAVGGYDTRQEVHQLATRGLAYGPDLVVVGFCLNDVIDERIAVNEVTGRVRVVQAPEHAAAEAAVADEQGGLATARFVARKVRSVTADMTRDEFGRWLLTTPGWGETRAALDRLADLSAAHSFDVVVVVFPFLVAFDDYLFAPLHAALEQQSRARGFAHLDLLPTFRAHDPLSLRSALSVGDYVHPNAAGHRLAADALLGWLRRWPALAGAP